MDRFTLEIELGSDAMRYPDDVAAALERVARRLAGSVGPQEGTIVDLNGNTVGHWTLT
jgi:hypothetical protein